MVLPSDVDNDLERMKEKEGGFEGRRATVKCEHKHGNVQREYAEVFLHFVFSRHKNLFPRKLGHGHDASLKRSIIPPFICNIRLGRPAFDKGRAMPNYGTCCDAKE